MSTDRAFIGEVPDIVQRRIEVDETAGKRNGLRHVSEMQLTALWTLERGAMPAFNVATASQLRMEQQC